MHLLFFFQNLAYITHNTTWRLNDILNGLQTHTFEKMVKCIECLYYSLVVSKSR